MPLNLRVLAGVLALFTTVTKAEPLYWQVSKGDLNLYVIGSVHVGTSSMYPLPKIITDTLTQGSGLIVETDTRDTNGVTYPPQTVKTKDILNQKQLTQLSAMAKSLGLNSERYTNMAPWATAIALQNDHLSQLGYHAENGVDTRMLSQATLHNIPVIGLEKLQFQIDLLTQQPDDGKELLLGMLKEWKSSKTTMQCLIQSWKAGDENNLMRFAEADGMSAQMRDDVVDKRNLDWANKLSSTRFYPNPQGNYVMVVGVLHLIGPNNVLDLMEKQGFSVTRLNQAKAANCDFE